jgi:hypothetical protein
MKERTEVHRIGLVFARRLPRGAGAAEAEAVVLPKQIARSGRLALGQAWRQARAWRV